MKPCLSEGQPEDELVRIEAESTELITMGYLRGELDMPDNVVPLSKAIQRMDEFSREVTDHWSGLDGSRVFYWVYACKDDFYLFSYRDGEICSDHRQDTRPKSPEKVYFRLMNGGMTPPECVCTDAMEYAEWAERKLAERWAYVMENSDAYRRWDDALKKWVNIPPENLFFDIYGDEYGGEYKYSYKNGQTFLRPFWEEGEGTEKKKRVIIKRWLHRPDAPELQDEYEVDAAVVDGFLRKLERGIYMEQLVAKAEGKELNPEQIFFETYDGESGAFLKKYRIVGYEIYEMEEDGAESYGSLPFMKKRQ